MVDGIVVIPKEIEYVAEDGMEAGSCGLWTEAGTY